MKYNEMAVFHTSAIVLIILPFYDDLEKQRHLMHIKYFTLFIVFGIFWKYILSNRYIDGMAHAWDEKCDTKSYAALWK